MSSSTTVLIDGSLPPDRVWLRVAAVAERWAADCGLPMRDVVLLVPFVQLIDPARRAFAVRGGWQPRIETTLTLAAALSPPRVPLAGELTGSASLDVLVMAEMLRAQGALAGWEQRDPLAFAQVVASTVEAAHSFYHAASAHAPAARRAWWAQAGTWLGSPEGPGSLEVVLCRIAFEWARAATAPSTDVLYEARPAAWVVVRAGGVDALPTAVLHAASCATLLIDADAPTEAPFADAAGLTAPRLVVADGLEAEAQATASAVIKALNDGQAPVALISLDRVLTRRVRALLERTRVALADETGWTLSTTRAAARVMALLRAARPDASADDRLEWLKAGESAMAQPRALLRLEALWRAGRQPEPGRDDNAARLWAEAAACLAPLSPSAPAGRRTLGAWLQAVAEVLEATRLAEALRADAAGAQVVAALRLAPEQRAEAAWARALQAAPVDLAGFTEWVDHTLEAANFVPPAAVAPDLVITPLARALLRPFGAVVIAGADERHLGSPAGAHGLLPAAAAKVLGIDTPTSRLHDERLALAHLLRVPNVTLLHRRLDGDEPVTASAAIDAIALARRGAGSTPIEPAPPATAWRPVDAVPVPRPAPVARHALPASLSASAVESLRACPYQFFARSVLGLREAEELDETIDKRDYGTWLHAVLDRFHRQRRASGSDTRSDADADAAALQAAADATAAEMALDTARLLPFRAGFEHLVPRYLAWLHERDAGGVRWTDGERSLTREPPELGGVRLQGRIDRIDMHGGTVELIDYKTGNVQGLRDRVRNRLEDTQLAFYALLMDADQGDPAAIGAGYLALDDSKAPLALAHPEVADSARALLQGLADDLRRLRAGAGLGALGEGTTCDHCEARGLCRRDHWAVDEAPT
jgi:ATP-dependent helicase/nuclease subunit B